VEDVEIDLRELKKMEQKANDRKAWASTVKGPRFFDDHSKGVR
jgi:hypothetical protein